MSDVIDLERRRLDTCDFTLVYILCIPCGHRDRGGITDGVDVFHIRCPECGAAESFVTFLPEGFNDAAFEGEPEQVERQVPREEL